MTKILIVDDAAFMRMRCGKLLKENGYEIVEAENGVQAVAKYKEESPDMVFMDVTMPEMDGITAVSEIKKIDPNCKVAMLSAMGQQTMVMDAIKAGAKDFVVKPFQPDKVLATVKKLLG